MWAHGLANIGSTILHAGGPKAGSCIPVAAPVDDETHSSLKARGPTYSAATPPGPDHARTHEALLSRRGACSLTYDDLGEVAVGEACTNTGGMLGQDGD